MQPDVVQNTYIFSIIYFMYCLVDLKLLTSATYGLYTVTIKWGSLVGIFIVIIITVIYFSRQTCWLGKVTKAPTVLRNYDLYNWAQVSRQEPIGSPK